MERKTKFCSCRLAAHQETGRVRWCIGHENTWQITIKGLVFLPIILLILVLFVIFLTRYLPVNKKLTENTSFISMKQFDEDEVLENEERREILKNVKTSFVPELLNNHTLKYNDKRKRRELFENFDENESQTNSIKWENLDKNNISLDDNVLIENSEETEIFWKNQLEYTEIRILRGLIMKKYMNTSVDPCENFYEYACGNWDKYHTIPADRASYDTFEILRENLDNVLRDLLESIEDEEENLTNEYYTFKKSYVQNNLFNSSTNTTIKIKNYFKSCMNEERLQQRNDKPLKKLLNDFGGWPLILQNWNESNFNLAWLMAQLRLFNNDILIAEWIGPDIINSKNYIIQIDQTTLGLPGRAYFLDLSYQKYLDAYQKFILTVSKLLGAADKQAEKDVIDLIEFETELSKIMIPNENRRNVTDLYIRTSIGALVNTFPQFDWIQYFTMVLNKKVSNNDPVACYCMEYLQKLMDLLENTPPRTIVNYLLWRFVKHRTNNLDQKFLDTKQKFYYVLFGREQLPARWQFCVSQVNSNMGMALGSLFVKKYFDESSKNDTLDMTMQLQEAFRIILNENNWLGIQTKDFARMKIDKMDLKIGYPSFLLNEEELNEIYSDIEIHPNYFFENTLSTLRHLTRIEQMRIGKEVNKSIWTTPPAVVNAYYSRNKNQIIFPAGILQPPFYHKHFPKSLNFGGIGVVIGHEITHGFDDKGRLFDQHGNLQQWWKEESMHKFHQRAKCLIEQYNSYIVPDVETFMDGFITQGENIADNGGLKQAFRAYERWLEDNPNADETLPGLSLTQEQLFFLNFAQVWCGKQRIDTVKSRLKIAVHSPGIFRVIGSLSNSEDFAKVFECPLNSPMNPERKCILW